MRSRFRPAPLVAIAASLVAVWIAAYAPQPALGATARCEPDALLSEEIRRSGVTFVGTVTESQPDVAGGGFVVRTRVEEVWHGPELDERAVLNDHRLRARALVAGARYLFIVSIATDGRPLELGQCDEALPLTLDLAGLRPAGARVLGEPAESRPVTSTGHVTPILAVVAVLLLGLAAVSWFSAGRLRASPLVWMARGGSLIGTLVAVGAVATTLPTVVPEAAPAVSFSPAAASPVGVTSTPHGAEDPTLVIRLDELTWMGDNTAVSVQADGRYITLDALSGPPVLQQRWLSAEGLDLVRAEIAATKLFPPDAAPMATFTPVLRQGAEPPGRDGFTRRISVAVDGSLRVIEYSPIFDGEREFYEPAPAIDQLERLAERLIGVNEWLPAGGWSQTDPEPYVADRYRITALAIPEAGSAEAALADLAWPIDTALTDLPAQRDSSGRPVGCAAIGRAAATELLASIGRLRSDRTFSLSTAFTVIHVVDDDGHVQVLTIRSLLPDQAGCDAVPDEPPAGTLEPGVVALVRVDGLRAREGAGSTFAAIDSFSAGERVVVTRGPTSADGLDWYEVREGPSDRVGWVSSGPADGDPWIVPVSNGAIAFVDNQSVRRMDPDGGNVIELADGGMPTWSSDGRHVALLVPPLNVQNAWQIAITNPDGSGMRRLVDGEDPQWSPDGTRMAFVRTGETHAIFVIGADGTNLEELTDGVSPAWSPDGGRIAFMRVDPDFEPPFGDGMVPWPYALWIRDLASGEEKALTPYDVLDGAPGPSWSPDGSQIAYGANRSVSADGGAPFVLRDGATWASDMPWSPDGEAVLIMEGGKLVIQDVDTEERRTLFDSSAPVFLQAAWSPDGTHVAYALGLDAPPVIFIIAAAGGEPMQVGPGNIQMPAWQPVVSVPLDD